MLDKLNRNWKTFTQDPRGSLAFRADNAGARVHELFSTLWCYLLAECWGISIGKGVRFVGVAHFFKVPTSRISIGDHCIFRSSKRSNFAGVNHPCMLQTFSTDAEIVIGDHSGFTSTSLCSIASLYIGNNVLIGPNTTILDGDGHAIDVKDKRSIEKTSRKPVCIEDHVWIGANVTILKGVTIGYGTVVGANSLVTRSLPPNVVAAGSPARVIRELEG